MKEKEFQKRVKESLKLNGAWVHKIADMPRGDDFRFIPEKPADIIGVYNGTPFLIECKMVKKIGKVSNTVMQGSKDKRLGRPFDEWHQVMELDRFIKHGGRSYLFLNLYLKEPRLNMCIPVPWEIVRPYLKANDFTVDRLKAVMTLITAAHYRKGYDLEIFLKGVAECKY